MSIYHRIIIVGAGPVGLYFATKCEKDNLDYVLLESTDKVGGQLTRLYPEKEIIDIDAFDSITAEQYISYLLKHIDRNRILLNEKVVDIKQGETISVKTTKEYTCDYLLIATGLGTSVPRPLGIENESKAKNIIYHVDDLSKFKNKRIVIFGGGDSALDWAKELSKISNDVHLVHRRLEFRGSPKTIENCKNIKKHLPFVPDHINLKGNVAESITIKEVVDGEKTPQIADIHADYIFVNYGNIAEQIQFNFAKDGAFLIVDNERFSVSKNIFAIGDIASYKDKKRRIQPGIEEADRVYKFIV